MVSNPKSLPSAVSTEVFATSERVLSVGAPATLVPFEASHSVWFATAALPPLPAMSTVAPRARASDSTAATRSREARSHDSTAASRRRR
jgi:hypothetical protein